MTRQERLSKQQSAARSDDPAVDPASAERDAEGDAGAAAFRSSLLLVLTADLVAIVAWLSWSRRSTSFALLALGAVVLPLVVVLLTNPPLRRVVALLARRETKRITTVAPIAASVVFASLGLTLGSHTDRLIAKSAVRHLGPIDELIVSPSADARNQALDALTRARSNDARVASSLDDLLPLVAADGSLQIGERRLGVTVMELDVAVAQTFGGVPDETGLVGFPSLSVGDIALQQSLVDTSGAPTVTSLSIGGFARSVRVLPMSRRNGFASVDVFGTGSPSLGRVPDRPVVFVAPGTITTAIDTLPGGGAAVNAQFLVAVSNRGTAASGLRRSGASAALLEETLANPPLGPVALAADDPLGLGGSVVSVAAPIEATVVTVKAAHVARLRAELATSDLARRLARVAMFTAALSCAAITFVARRRHDRLRYATIRSLGLRRRAAVAVETALLGTSVFAGLVLGLLASLLARTLVGTFAPLDAPVAGDPRTTAQALTLAGLLALVPVLVRPLAQLVPRPLRRLLKRIRSLPLPGPSGPLLAVGLVVVSVVLLRHRTSESALSAGLIALVVGVAAVLGVTVLPRPPFGRRTFARPTRRLRARCFAGVAAATGLVVLPVAASQGLSGSAAAVANGAWRSVVVVQNEADASGLAGQLVRASAGRVLNVTSLLVGGGPSGDPATPALALAAGDGLGDSWVPVRARSGPGAPGDLPPGSVVVSDRLAGLRGGALVPGDRLVLLDPHSTRSVSVVIHDIASFPPWAGDIAASSDVYTGLLTTERVSTARRVIAVSTMTPDIAQAALRSLAPNATATVRGTDSMTPSLSAALVGWFRRAALLTLGIAVALALVFRSLAWRPIHWTVVVSAAAFGWLVATTVGGPPTRTPLGPLAAAFALAGFCGVSALRVLTPDLRFREVVRHVPRRTKDTGEYR